MRNLKKYCIFLFFALSVAMLFFPCNVVIAQNLSPENKKKSDIDQFPALPISSYSVTSIENPLLQGHLYNKSQGTSVEINQINLGTGNIISPPFFCYPFSSQFQLFHQPVPVKEYEWYSANTIVQGATINGIASNLIITPLWNTRGILAEITFLNTSDHEINFPVEWFVNGRIGKSNNWEWYPPFAMKSNQEDIKVKPNSDAIEFQNDSSIVLVKSIDIKPNPDHPNSFERQIILPPNKNKSLSLVILLGNDSKTLNKKADQILKNPEEARFNAVVASDKTLEDIESKVPALAGCAPELDAFYKKGLLTFSTCRWVVPEFITSPWYAESGMDGGALNNYCWGVAYISRLMSMIDPAAVRKLLITYVTSDLQKTYALNPATGKGMGVLYSYNYYSIAKATYDYITITGDQSILNEMIGSKTYLETIYHFCLSREDLNADPQLINFGGNENLLELKRTTNYSNFTPSPNAERLLIYRYLTDFYSWFNKPTPNDLTKRGEKLKSVYQSKLWDSKNKWLYCLDSEQSPKTAYSIQIFDVLRTGALTKTQKRAIISHLNTNEFLTEWGVRSLAITDKGYDSADVDWGGPGVYAGDAPELIEDLLNAGFVNQGIDLLKRIQWWSRFPYYPQAIRADRMGYREDGRPNEIAGLATTQTIIFGLFGISIGKDFISIKPVNHPFTKDLSLTDLMIRGKKIDISINKDKAEFSVSVEGKSYKSRMGKKIIIKI